MGAENLTFPNSSVFVPFQKNIKNNVKLPEFLGRLCVCEDNLLPSPKQVCVREEHHGKQCVPVTVCKLCTDIHYMEKISLFKNIMH